jgi:hypothetical protein
MDEKGNGTAVYIRVYHLHPINKAIRFVGLGLFHSAIEAHGKEYWFGANNTGKTGVCETRVNFHKLPLHQRIHIGNTLKTAMEVKKDAYSIRKYWLGKDYDVFNKNCNHFAEEYLKVVLGYSAFPTYINRITMLEPILRPFIKPIMAISQAMIPKGIESNDCSDKKKGQKKI